MHAYFLVKFIWTTIKL